jgi:hypothetical protein
LPGDLLALGDRRHLRLVLGQQDALPRKWAGIVPMPRNDEVAGAKRIPLDTAANGVEVLVGLDGEGLEPSLVEMPGGS